MAKGYVYAEIEVTNPERYRDYMAKSKGAVEAHGGRFLVRGGAPEVMEGDRRVTRVVIVEFDTIERARAFYHSAQYREAAAIRHESAVTHYYLLAGA